MSLFIRPAREEDLESLAANFNCAYGRSHRDDILDQEAGHVSFLLAILNGDIAGQGFVNWSGPRDQEIACLYSDCPEIYRFDVLETLRSKGIGSALLTAFEEEAQAREFQRIGLGVAHYNHRARALYERSGFKPVDPQSYIDSYVYENEKNEVVRAEDACAWYIKEFAR